MVPVSVKILFAVGALGMIVGIALFIAMALELNRNLPQQKRFFILELRERFHEVKDIHEEQFPVSTKRTAWFVLTVASVLVMTAALILGVRPR